MAARAFSRRASFSALDNVLLRPLEEAVAGVDASVCVPFVGEFHSTDFSLLLGVDIAIVEGHIQCIRSKEGRWTF